MLKGGPKENLNKLSFFSESYLLEINAEKETNRSKYFESIRKIVKYMIDNSLALKRAEDSLRQ